MKNLQNIFPNLIFVKEGTFRGQQIEIIGDKIRAVGNNFFHLYNCAEIKKKHVSINRHFYLGQKINLIELTIYFRAITAIQRWLFFF